MAPDAEEPQQPSKRRKVVESCKGCRSKKTRCDGQRPECSPCMTKGLACEYNDITIPVPVSSISDLEARLRKLEREASTAPIARGAAYSNLSTTADASGDLVSHSPVGISRQIAHDSSIGDRNAGIGTSFTEHPTTQFMQDMTRIVNTQATIQPQGSIWPKADPWPVETDASMMVVPQRAIADDLLDCYEAYVYPLFPILHMPRFRQSYECLWKPQKDAQFETMAAEATFHAILNMVFALGCLSTSNIEPQLKLRRADGFYQRARTLLPLDALDFPSLGVVQYLLLTTNYLSFTKYSNRCFNTLAVAIRVAQTLGLHMDVEASSNNQLKREMSRRVWHHCLTLERLLSSLFGRKTMVEPDNLVPLPAAIDDLYLLEEGVGIQPSGVPSILDSFIVTVKLFEVIEKACEIKYASFTNGLRLLELTKVLQLNEEVDQIENSLPSHLKHDNDAKTYTAQERVLKLQAEAVVTRILHVRIILLRPTVLAAARQSLTSSAAPELSLPYTRTALRTEVSAICVQAGVSVIRILHANLRSASRIFSVNAVFIALSAATVIVAASLVPELDVSVEAGSGHYGDAITKALQVLEEHRWQVEGAWEAKAQLEKFVETVSQARRRRNDGNGILVDPSQPDGGQLPFATEEFIGGIDFTDPLWSFQWDGSIPLFNAPGPIV